MVRAGLERELARTQKGLAALVEDTRGAIKTLALQEHTALTGLDSSPFTIHPVRGGAGHIVRHTEKPSLQNPVVMADRGITVFGTSTQDIGEIGHFAPNVVDASFGPEQGEKLVIVDFLKLNKAGHYRDASTAISTAGYALRDLRAYDTFPETIDPDQLSTHYKSPAALKANYLETFTKGLRDAEGIGRILEVVHDIDASTRDIDRTRHAWQKVRPY